LLGPQQLSNKAVPYSAVAALPIETYAIRKRDFYEYINDKTKKSFMKYLR